MENSNPGRTGESGQGIEDPARSGFWSYVVADDEADGGRLGDLAQDVNAQHEASAGETVELFFGGMSLEWSDDWRTETPPYAARISP